MKLQFTVQSVKIDRTTVHPGYYTEHALTNKWDHTKQNQHLHLG